MQKEAHRVCFLVTISLVSWKQTQWAAFYFPRLVKGRKFYAQLLRSGSFIDIANALHVSADDILVDSLHHSVSTADSDLHRLLLDCNKVEEQILTRNAQELKKILYGLGI